VQLWLGRSLTSFAMAPADDFNWPASNRESKVFPIEPAVIFLISQGESGFVSSHNSKKSRQSYFPDEDTFEIVILLSVDCRKPSTAKSEFTVLPQF
jgi:hypothetical protein